MILLNQQNYIFNYNFNIFSFDLINIIINFINIYYKNEFNN